MNAAENCPTQVKPLYTAGPYSLLRVMYIRFFEFWSFRELQHLEVLIVEFANRMSVL
jgi:hypothetical protein